MSPEALIPAQRREQLMELLRTEGVLSVHQLTDQLGVSHMTVRRDIAELEREGRANSIAGGVQLPGSLRVEPTFTDKSNTDQSKKRGIAASVAPMLEDGMSIYVDAGTTTGALVPHLFQHSNMTVVTNDFAIVDRLMANTSNTILHTGGRLEAPNRSAVGPFAAKMLRDINVDIAFISTSSWDVNHGITTPHDGKTDVKRAAMDSAETNVLLAASTKYGKYGIYSIAELAAFDRIATDTGLANPSATSIRDLGVELLLCEPTQIAETTERTS